MRSLSRWLWIPCCAALAPLGGAAAFAQSASEELAFELALPPQLAEDPLGFKGDRIMVLHAEDGFDTKLVKGAPYQAEAVTEVVQTLADGNRIVRKTTAAVYRDGEGRTRREGHLAAIGPLVGGEALRSVFLTDPVAGTRYHLDLDERVAHKLPAAPRFAAAERPAPGPRDRVVFKHGIVGPDGKTVRERVSTGKSESLGTRAVEGIEAEGTRIRNVIPAGEIGNERPIEIVSERWYSPELQVVVSSRHSDPRLGETTYRLQNLSRGEPDRALFEVPADFKVSDAPAHKRVRHLPKQERPD